VCILLHTLLFRLYLYILYYSGHCNPTILKPSCLYKKVNFQKTQLSQSVSKTCIHLQHLQHFHHPISLQMCVIIEIETISTDIIRIYYAVNYTCFIFIFFHFSQMLSLHQFCKCNLQFHMQFPLLVTLKTVRWMVFNLLKPRNPICYMRVSQPEQSVNVSSLKIKVEQLATTSKDIPLYALIQNVLLHNDDDDPTEATFFSLTFSYCYMSAVEKVNGTSYG